MAHCLIDHRGLSLVTCRPAALFVFPYLGMDHLNGSLWVIALFILSTVSLCLQAYLLPTAIWHNPLCLYNAMVALFLFPSLVIAFILHLIYLGWPSILTYSTSLLLPF